MAQQMKIMGTYGIEARERCAFEAAKRPLDGIAPAGRASRFIRKLLVVAGLAGTAHLACGQQVLLSWLDESLNEDGFSVERSANGGLFAEIGETAAGEVSFVDSDVAPGNLYEYRVRAYNIFGYSPYTNTVSKFYDAQATEEPELLLGPNLLKNGDFESGRSDWRFYTSGSGGFDTPISDVASLGDSARIRLYSRANNIQLFQNGISLKENTGYELSFYAYTNSGHDVQISLSKHTSPYTNYGLNKSHVDLDTGWSKHTIRFTSTNVYGSVGNARLFFWMADDAAGGDHYWIDDVRLSEITGETTVENGSESDDTTISTAEGSTADGSTTDGSADDTTTDDSATGVDSATDSNTTDDGAESDTSATDPEQPTVDLGEGIVQNGGFEDGLTDWNFYANSRSNAIIVPGYDSSPSAVEVEIVKVGTNIQLYQNGLRLLPNTPYRLTFAAYSNVGRDMSISLGKHSTPYTNYGLNSLDIDLDKDWNYYTVTFTTANFDSMVDDGRLFFWFADRIYGGERFYIDKVSLAALPDENAPSVPTDFVAKRYNSQKVMLTWSPSTDDGGQVGYMVYRDGIDIGYSTTTEYFDEGTPAAGPHVYTVTAFDADGNESAPSDESAVGR